MAKLIQVGFTLKLVLNALLLSGSKIGSMLKFRIKQFGGFKCLPLIAMRKRKEIRLCPLTKPLYTNRNS